jgi:hypothetical protein
MVDRKALFNKIYANLPLPSRSEIVAVVDGEPITWNVLRIEVENDTEKAKKALDILEQLDILKE